MTTTQRTSDNDRSVKGAAAPLWQTTEYETASFFEAADPAIELCAHPDVEKRAIWIVHGMGQQVPFETLDSLTQGVGMALENNPDGWSIDGDVRAVTTKFQCSKDSSKTQVVQRVEIDLHKGTHRLQLHLYEAYWAPLTEGVAKLSDVVSFLFDAGLHGILNSRKRRPFRRVMFPTNGNPFWNFHIPFTSPMLIGVTLLLLVALGIINAAIAAASAARMKESFFGSWTGTSASLPHSVSQYWYPLTAIATAITAIAFTFAAVLFLAEMTKGSPAPAAAKDAAAKVTVALQPRLSSLMRWASSLIHQISFFKRRNGDTGDQTKAHGSLASAGRAGAKSPDEAARDVVESIWAFPTRLLSWTSLITTVLAIIVGAACLALIPWLSEIGNWFSSSHFHLADWLGRFLSDAANWSQTMPSHATQFVSTVAIALAILLCGFAALRRAALRSIGLDYREGRMPRFLFFLSAFGLQISLILLLVHIQYHRYDPHTPISWLLWAFTPETLVTWQRRIVNVFGSPFWVWPALIALSKVVRDLIVEYPGDVTIYVASNKLDRFDEVRNKIKQVALDSLMPLYSAYTIDSDAKPATRTFLYSKIAVIGHSLGSVIAYDTLNKLITLDVLLNEQLQVADRTAIFETFGSPLDKTAFFFTFQGKNSTDVRQLLAAAKQPLIQSYDRFRKFPWINVRSASDIISGKLKFYDVPDKLSPPAVDNVTDKDAIVPLIAHVEYWKNPTVWSYLVKAITAPPPSVSTPGPGTSKQGASKLPPHAPKPTPPAPAIS